MIKLSRKVLCLDWDKRSLRIVVARVGKGRIFLEDAHSHRLPNNVDADDAEALGEFIRGMLRRHRLRHKTAVVDVPRERAVINRLALPPTPTNEVAAGVRFQAMKELPFPIDSAAVDYVITQRNDKGLATEVLLAAITQDTLNRVRATCEAAGLTPARIGLRPYANMVAVRKVEETRDQRVLFVDVGPGATEIDVISNHGLSFARSANVNVPIPTGEGASREDSRVISLAEIADLDSADEAIEAAVNELLVEVTRTLQAYRATDPTGGIDKVLIAGGTGIETQLAERLQQRLGYPVRLFDPTGPLGIAAGESAKLRSFSATLGLAWGVSSEGLLALDFLNPKRPVSSRETLRKRVRTGGIAAAMVLAGALTAYGWIYQDKAATLAALQRQRNALRDVLKKKIAVRHQVEQVREWQADTPWPDELLAITRLANAADDETRLGDQLVLQEISLDARSRNPGITLRNVYATDWEVPTEFVTRLNELKLDGKRPYVATQGTWTNVSGQRYHGKVDIQIDLRRLRELRNEAAQNEKERKKEAKRFGLD